MNKLITIQKKLFPKIIEELNEYQMKVNHWSWYVWPTERKGYHDKYKTYIKKNKIKFLLDNTDVENWIIILQLLNQFINDNESLNIIPEEDYGRMEEFYKLFLSNKIKKYDNFFNEIIKQQQLFFKYKK